MTKHRIIISFFSVLIVFLVINVRTPQAANTNIDSSKFAMLVKQLSKCEKTRLPLNDKISQFIKNEREIRSLASQLEGECTRLEYKHAALMLNFNLTDYIVILHDAISDLTFLMGTYKLLWNEIGLSRTKQGLELIINGLKQLGEEDLKKNLGIYQAKKEAKDALGIFRLSLNDLKEMIQQLWEKKNELDRNIQHYKHKRENASKECENIIRKLLIQSFSPPPDGGYWELVSTENMLKKDTHEQCYDLSASGGSCRVTHTIDNKCQKPPTQFIGEATWSNLPTRLIPEKKCVVAMTVRKLQQDKNLFQSIHLSAKLEPVRINCGYTAGGSIGKDLKVSSKEKELGKRAEFTFNVPSFGEYASGTTGEGKFAILLCTPHGGFKYIYKWVHKNTNYKSGQTLTQTPNESPTQNFELKTDKQKDPIKRKFYEPTDSGNSSKHRWRDAY